MEIDIEIESLEELEYFAEIALFVLCIVCAAVFLFRWYRYSILSWQPHGAVIVKCILALLPPLALYGYFYTLTEIAAFDVIGDFFYIIFYIVLGFAWIWLGMLLLSALFGLSWLDDASSANNRGAALAVAGVFLSLTAVYAGANVGDGPGFWCVLFAGGLGLAWLLLMIFAYDRCTNAVRAITSDRDSCAGLRMGAYVVALGIVLARACSGDWTSFLDTVLEFTDAWATLPLLIMMVVSERLLVKRAQHSEERSAVLPSVALSILFIVLAVAYVVFMPRFYMASGGGKI